MISTSTAAPRTLPITLPPQREKESGPAAQWNQARPPGFADKVDRSSGQKPFDTSPPSSTGARHLQDDAATREHVKLKRSQELDTVRRTRPTVQQHRVDDSPPSDPIKAPPELAALLPASDGGEIASDRSAAAAPAGAAGREATTPTTAEPWWAALLAPSPVPTPTPVPGADNLSAAVATVDAQPIATTKPPDAGDGVGIEDARTIKLAAEAAEAAKAAATERPGGAGVGAAQSPQGSSTSGDADRLARDATRKLPGTAEAANGARAISLDRSSASASVAPRDQTADVKALAADEPPVVVFAAAPGPITPASTTAAAVPTRLSAPPGSPDFAAQLGTALTAFVRQGVHHARLELNPAEMGPLTVQIQLEGDRAQVHLAAEHAQTRVALEQSMPHLAGSLREAGLTLTGGGVSDRAPRQPPLPPDWDEASSQRTQRNRRNEQDTDIAIGAAGAAQSTSQGRTGGRRGVVDLVA